MFKVALVAFDCGRGQGPGYFDDVLVPVHIVGVRAAFVCVSVSAASAYPHHLCGTTCRLN